MVMISLAGARVFLLLVLDLDLVYAILDSYASAHYDWGEREGVNNP